MFNCEVKAPPRGRGGNVLSAAAAVLLFALVPLVCRAAEGDGDASGKPFGNVAPTRVEPLEWNWTHWWEANQASWLNRPTRQEPGSEVLFQQRREAIALLERALGHDASDVRAAAALAAGWTGELVFQKRLEQHARRDRDDGVRRAAMLALGLLSAPRSAAALGELRIPADDEDAAVALLTGIALLDDRPGQAGERLRAGLKRGDEPETQAAAAWAMGRRAGPADPADRAALLGVVRQSDEPLPVSAALVALGAHQGEEVLDLLAEVLLERSAAEALPVWKRLDKRDRAGLLFLREAIKRQDGRRPPTRRDKIPPRGPGRLIFGEERIYIARLRAAAAIGLGRIGDRRAVQPLVLTLMEEEGRYNDLPRGFSAIALGEIGDPRGRKPLLVTLARTRDEDDEVRGFAAIGLGLHVRASAAAEPGEQALNLLASRLLDEREDDEVRAGCALALGLTGSTQTLRHLRSAMQRLDENDLEIAGYVLLARAMLGDPEILPVAERVLELTGDERRISDRLARRTTILALGVLGSAEAVPTLSALWESDEDFRRHATRALVTAGRAEAGRLVLDAVRRTDDSDDLAGYLRLLGEVFAERPNALARLTADTNFTMPHNELRDYQELASEFLYDELIPALGEKWR